MMGKNRYKFVAILLIFVMAVTYAGFSVSAKEFFAGEYSEEYHNGGYDAGYDPNYNCNLIDDQDIKYVIDENFTFTEQSDNYLPDKYVPSGWDVRTIGGRLMGPYYHSNWQMIDTSDIFPVQANRKFEMLSRGEVALEYLFTLQDAMDDAAWRVYKNNTVALGIVTNGGNLYLEQNNGQNIFLSDYALNKMYGVKIVFNIDTHTIRKIYLDGKIVGEDLPFVNNVDYVNNFDVKTSDKGTGTLALHGVYMYRGYAVNEKFIASAGINVPDDYVPSVNGGSVSINTTEANQKPDIYSLQISGNAAVTKNFDTQSGHLIIEFSMIAPEKTDGISVDFMSDGNPVFSIVTQDGQYCYKVAGGNSTAFYDYWANVWYNFKIDMDLENSKADIYLNYILRQKDIQLSTDYNTLNSMKMGAIDKTVKFDSIFISQFVPEPEDYCPEPQVAINPDYRLGMQFCPMWRTGSHVGWDGPNADKDRLPYLGYYDEGSPEVADWLIKQLTEHCISFQRVIWCGMPNETEPGNIAIMGGNYLNAYKQAKYSNLMDYMIMWENVAMGGTAERLVNVVGPYWIEHYIKDDRYLRINGRPIVAFLDASYYLKYNDYDMERAKKGLADFRQLCINAGVGDPILAVGGGNIMDSENVRTIKELGFDAISPYGTQVGCYYEQDKMIFTQRQRLDGIIDFCPTFSSGLYGMSSGTSGYVPNDMIKTFLQRFKDEYVPTSSEDNILANMAIFDTYDEYVEGHYYAVCGRTGFALFDIIRDVFGDGQPHVDIVPTMKQKNRFNNLYPYGRFIPPFNADTGKGDIDVNNLKVKKGWYFDTPGDSEGWANWGDISNYGVRDGCLSGTVSGPDPIVAYSGNIDISDVVYVKIKIRITGTAGMGQIFFATKDSPGTSEGKSDFINTYTNDFEEKMSFMAANKEWKGTLTVLRIDPVNAADGQTFDIDSIELLYDETLNAGIIPEQDKPGFKICVDGTYKKMGKEFITAEDKNYYPMRNIAEYLNAKKIDYDEKNDKVNILYNDTWIQFDIANNQLYVNGDEDYREKSFVIDNGTLYVDDRTIALTFGVDTEWNGTDTLFILTSKGEAGGETRQRREILYGAEFEYDGELEGWTNYFVKNLVVQDGKLKGEPDGGSPVLWTPGGINVRADSIKNISVAYKNDSNVSTARFYFITDIDPNWGEDKTIIFNVNSNDSEISVYNIDPSAIEKFNGIITQIRFDPCSGANSGRFEIEYFRLEGDIAASGGETVVTHKTVTPEQISWEFNTNGEPDGWKLSKSLGNVRLENGILKALVVGPTPSMTTLGNLNIPASKISKILIKLKNNTDSDKAKLYFITDESDCWCGEKVFEFSTNANDTIFATYEIETSANPYWKGIINGFKLEPTYGKGEIEVNYIRLQY